MTRAQTLAINQHWSSYGLVIDEEINLNDLFADKKLVILEIGSGMGEATAQIAQASDEVGYVAVEMHQPGLAALILLILEKQLSNIKLIREDATYLLANFIADNSIDGIHLLFPDPWPKRRHHKNRLMQADFLSQIAAKAGQGLRLYFRTDDIDYFDAAKAAVMEHPAWQVLDAPWAFEYETVFQERAAGFHSLVACLKGLSRNEVFGLKEDLNTGIKPT
jgi:tRNA (guanine-N7-)-methyltransferase